MKKAFTMIELIFVIVIIGILASVAIPKLAGTRDDAEAAICINEVGRLIHEISNAYTEMGYNQFITKTATGVTNIRLVTAEDTSHGIKSDTKVDTTGIIYICDSVDLVNITGKSAGTDYNLTVTVSTGSTPISMMTAESVKKNILNGATSKQFTL